MMRSRLKIIYTGTLLCLVFSTTIPAQQPAVINTQAGPAEQFDAARKAYDDGDLTRAIALYENLLNQEYRPAEVYFNLGNACFRTGNNGKAILHFKRALLLDPRNHDIKANLRFAVENAGALVPRGNLLFTFTQQATLNEWLILVLIFWWLTAAAWILRLALPSRSEAANRLILCFGLLLLITLASALQNIRLRAHPEAVVTAKGQSALSAPLAGATTLFHLPEGSIVRVTERSGEWLHITAGDQSGWIRQGVCEPVPVF